MAAGGGQSCLFLSSGSPAHLHPFPEIPQNRVLGDLWHERQISHKYLGGAWGHGYWVIVVVGAVVSDDTGGLYS